MTLPSTIKLLQDVSNDYHELDSETREKKEAINNAITELAWLVRERDRTKYCKTEQYSSLAEEKRYTKLPKISAR